MTVRVSLPLDRQCALAGLPVPVAEHRFHPTRKWAMDFAWPERLIALEVEGGAWTQGRHTRGAGFLADMVKYREAAILGWRLIRCTPSEVQDGTALTLIERVLKA